MEPPTSAAGDRPGDAPPRRDMRRLYAGVLLMQAGALLGLWLLQSCYGTS